MNETHEPKLQVVYEKVAELDPALSLYLREVLDYRLGRVQELLDQREARIRQLILDREFTLARVVRLLRGLE